MARIRTRRTRILALLLVAGGLAAGAVVWQATTRTTSTTSGTIGGGNVHTSARGADACAAQASAFTDYPLVFAGPSVLGYPLTSCDHTMTKTRHLADGSYLSPGSDSWAFSYGTCTIPEGRETCSLPVSIIIDPCALSVDGRIIPKASQPVRSMTVRGAQAGISQAGTLIFEQSPQIIHIYAPPHVYLGQGVEAYAAEKAANAVLVAEALVPANPPAAAAASALAAKPGSAPAADTLIPATLGATKVACP